MLFLFAFYGIDEKSKRNMIVETSALLFGPRFNSGHLHHYFFV